MTQDRNPRESNENPQPAELNQDELDNVAGGTRRGSDKRLPPPLGGVTPAVVWNSDEPPINFSPPPHKKGS